MNAIVGQEGVEFGGVFGVHAVRAALKLYLQFAKAGLHRDGMIDRAVFGDGVGATMAPRSCRTSRQAMAAARNRFWVVIFQLLLAHDKADRRGSLR